MKKILLLGTIAAILFSCTFTINDDLYDEYKTPWFWIASLRYLNVFVILSILFLLTKGSSYYKNILKCYAEHWKFWTVAGSIGFGLFYMPLCFAIANKMSLNGWLEAVIWQFTIIASPIVLYAMGKHVSKKIYPGIAIVSIGILMVLSSMFTGFGVKGTIFSILAVIFASFCYPIGNNLCKNACLGEYEKYRVDKYEVTKNPFSLVLLMTMGSAPIFILVGLIVQPTIPVNFEEYKLISEVAIISGIAATGIFYYARQLANNASKTAIVDATQAIEVPAAVILGIQFGDEISPNGYGWIGISIIILGIWLFNYLDAVDKKKKEDQSAKLEEIP